MSEVTGPLKKKSAVVTVCTHSVQCPTCCASAAKKGGTKGAFIAGLRATGWRKTKYKGWMCDNCLGFGCQYGSTHLYEP